jgi:hypothetical protein
MKQIKKTSKSPKKGLSIGLNQKEFDECDIFIQEIFAKFDGSKNEYINLLKQDGMNTIQIEKRLQDYGVL